MAILVDIGNKAQDSQDEQRQLQRRPIKLHFKCFPDLHQPEKLQKCFEQCRARFLNRQFGKVDNAEESFKNRFKLLILEVVFVARMKNVKPMAVVQNLKTHGIHSLYLKDYLGESYREKDVKGALKKKLPEFQVLSDKGLKWNFIVTFNQAKKFLFYEQEVKPVCPNYQGKQCEDVPLSKVKPVPHNYQEKQCEDIPLSKDPRRKLFGDVVLFEYCNGRDIIRCLPYKLGETNFAVTIYLYNGDGKAAQRLEEDARQQFCHAKVKVIDLALSPPSGTPIRYPNGYHVLQKETVEQISKEIEQKLDSFTRHRNVTAVYASYKVQNFCQTTIPCVKVCVLGKGRIPLGDRELPARLGSFEIDVEEGYFAECVDVNPCWRSSSPLNLGVSIGMQGVDGSGTLGAFLVNSDNNFFVLSCKHVMNPRNDVKPDVGIVEQPSSLDYANYKAYYKMKLENQKALVSRLEKLEEKQTFSRALKEARNRQKIYEIKTQNTPPRQIAEYKSGIKGNVEHCGYEYFIDAAIAELSKPEAQLLQTVGVTMADENAQQPTGKCRSLEMFFDPERMKLQKVGRTTALTKNGILDPSSVNILCNQADIDCTDPAMHSGSAHAFCFHCSNCGAKTEMNGQDKCSSCRHANLQQWRHNCLLIREELGGFFAKVGDSGAMVIDENGDACGVIFGFLDVPSCDQYFVLACPMEVVLAYFRKEFDQTLQIVSVKRDAHQLKGNCSPTSEQQQTA